MKEKGKKVKKKLITVNSRGVLANNLVHGGISAIWSIVNGVFLQFTLLRNSLLLS